jgi:para-nitrobenzyl esterase
MSDVPVIIGSTKNEFVQAFNTPDFVNPVTEQDAREILFPKYKKITDEFIKAVKKAYPDAKRPLDLLEVDIRGRASTVHLANLKARQGKVYAYLFAWESPVLEGRFRSCHCLELPFVFNNIERCQEMTGGGVDAYQLADKMSQAWINFACYGDPNHSRLPKWEPYSQKNGATMIFDNACKLGHHHDKALIDLVTEHN